MGSYRLYKLPIFLSILLISCECPERIDSRYVDRMEAFPGGDTIASVSDPGMKFGFEVKYRTVQQDQKKSGLPCKRNLILGIDMKTWIIPDSTSITCDRDLPGINAGSPITNNENFYIQNITETVSGKMLDRLVFNADWSKAEWNSMPDSAWIFFTFLSNTGIKLRTSQKIHFKK